MENSRMLFNYKFENTNENQKENWNGNITVTYYDEIDFFFYNSKRNFYQILIIPFYGHNTIFKIICLFLLSYLQTFENVFCHFFIYVYKFNARFLISCSFR